MMTIPTRLPKSPGDYPPDLRQYYDGIISSSGPHAQWLVSFEMFDALKAYLEWKERQSA